MLASNPLVWIFLAFSLGCSPSLGQKDAVLPLVDYDESIANSTCLYAAAAYCSLTGMHEALEAWTCPACKELPYMSVKVVYDSSTGISGFVGYDPHSNFIMVSFAGTDPLDVKNWIDDINIFRVSYPATNCSKCEVHEGFYNSYKAIRPKVFEMLNVTLAAHPTATLRVTGHSLGAALAAHFTLQMALEQPDMEISAVYTFGQPRVGNDEFQQFFTQQVAASYYRVTHWRDPVPSLPPEGHGLLFNFHHMPREVFYTEDNSKYRVCDGSGEDPKCIDSHINFNVLDHLSYMNYSFIENYINCKF